MCIRGGHLTQNIEHLVTKKSDIIKRINDNSIQELDFLKASDVHNGWIVTNPPYKYALEFCEKALELSTDGVAMFLRIQFMEGAKRRKFFDKSPFSYAYIYSKRVKCVLDGDFIKAAKAGSSAVCFAWFIWDKTIPKAEPIVRWI